MSLANASSTFNDVWAFHDNPGALADVDKVSVGISYENRFLLKDLQSQAIAVSIPLKVGVLSFGGNLYGYSQYRPYKAGVGYSMKLSEVFYARYGVSIFANRKTLGSGAEQITGNTKPDLTVQLRMKI